MMKHVLMVLLLLSLVNPLSAQRPLNLSFEEPSVAGDNRPWGWTLGWSAFAGGPGASFTRDSSVRRDGAFSLRITVDGASSKTHALMLQLPAKLARGKRVSLRAWSRTSGEVRALVLLEAWKDRAFASADTASLQETGTWTAKELSILVPDDPGVHSIVVSTALQGVGSGWFDAFELSIDGMSMQSLPEEASVPGPAQRSWLRTRASPLSEEWTPDERDRSLERFDSIVGSARIVALGESTHGTREFFQAKHRLLTHLVRHHGFRVFAIEANQLAVERINAWVNGGPGDAAQVMRAMFAVWNTEEVLALVEWMRSYNATNPRQPVRFAGYDMQDHRTPADTLRSFFERRAPQLRPLLDSMSPYLRERSYATPHVAEATRMMWSRAAEALYANTHAQRDTWLRGSRTRADSIEALYAVQAANLIRQAARFNIALNSPERDSLMASNLQWYLETIAPGQRAVVWAHDVHVSHGGDARRSFNAGQQMGAYLRRWHGDGYRALSLLTFEGSYGAARSFTDHRRVEARAFPGPASSIEGILHQLFPGSYGAIVDLRDARADTSQAWLWEPRPIRHVGYAAYDYGFEFNVVMPLEFDGIVFIDRTRPSRPVR